MNTTIDKEYLDALKQAGLLDRYDPKEISSITRKSGIRNGRGYSAEQIRNFLYRGHTCTDEMVTIFIAYFDRKAEMKKVALDKKEEFINKLQELIG